MLHHLWKQRQRTLLVILLLTVIASPLAFAGKEIQWEKAIEKGLAEAKKTGKPIMMDFYTDW
jgi:thiol:disulfide interchange protein